MTIWLFKSMMGLSALMSSAAAVSAQQPPDILKSDVDANTSAETTALLNNNGGLYDTAVGEGALHDNSNGARRGIIFRGMT